MTSFRKIAITTGDRDGIGFEVTAKALCGIPASLKKNKAVFFIFRHRRQTKRQPRYFRMIDRHWTRLTFNSLPQALSFLELCTPPDNLLVDLALQTSEALWVEEAARACGAQKLDSLVTGPLSKKITARLPGKDLGHTGIFRRLYPRRPMFMSFIGRDFNVLLATDHQPLAGVEAALRRDGLSSALKAAAELRRLLGSNKKIAVLGFNPHAGERGLIGGTEKALFRRLPAEAEGPLVPDAAFLKKNWTKYSLFVCLYHDQGLIPFKMQHGQDSGVHLTLGLPFLRTSVDHGTAADLFNKNIANSASMLEAITLNLKLLNRR